MGVKAIAIDSHWKTAALELAEHVERCMVGWPDEAKQVMFISLSRRIRDVTQKLPRSDEQKGGA